MRIYLQISQRNYSLMKTPNLFSIPGIIVPLLYQHHCYFENRCFINSVVTKSHPDLFLLHCLTLIFFISKCHFKQFEPELNTTISPKISIDSALLSYCFMPFISHIFHIILSFRVNRYHMVSSSIT